MFMPKAVVQISIMIHHIFTMTVHFVVLILIVVTAKENDGEKEERKILMQPARKSAVHYRLLLL